MSDIEDSGEVFLKHTMREHSQSQSNISNLGSGRNSPDMEQRAAISSLTSGNTNESIVKALQNHFAKEFAQLHDRLDGQLVSIHKDFNGKFESLHREIEVVKGSNPTNPTDLHNNHHVHVPIWEGVRPSPTPHSLGPQTQNFGRNNQDRNIHSYGNRESQPILGRTNQYQAFQMGDMGPMHPPQQFSTPFPDRNENRGLSPFVPHTKEKTKPRVYDGNEDFDDYISQFEIIADLNKWDYRTKSLQLAGNLAKEACGLLGELNEGQRRDYDSLVHALKMRFGSMERAEMFRTRLKVRTKGRNESLSELAQSIKKLTRQSYPRAEPGMTDILALDHFIDALPDPDMRLRLRESRPKDIGEAEILAIRLETYKLADTQRISAPASTVNSINTSKPTMESLLEKLCEKVDKLVDRNDQNKYNGNRQDGYHRNTGNPHGNPRWNAGGPNGNSRWNNQNFNRNGGNNQYNRNPNNGQRQVQQNQNQRQNSPNQGNQNASNSRVGARQNQWGDPSIQQ